MFNIKDRKTLNTISKVVGKTFKEIREILKLVKKALKLVKGVDTSQEKTTKRLNNIEKKYYTKKEVDTIIKKLKTQKK